MAEQVAVAAPAAQSAPVSQEAQPQSQENQEIEASEGEESSEEDQEASSKEEKPAKPSKKEQKKQEARIKKLKLKVDGQELEEELNLDDDEALIRQLQMAKMGQKRAKEKADLEKQLGMFFNELQKNPLGVLAQIGRAHV